MFREYDTFILARPIQGETIEVGTRGVVLMVHSGDRTAYEVEFCDEKGMNLGTQMTFTLHEESMKPEDNEN